MDGRMATRMDESIRPLMIHQSVVQSILPDDPCIQLRSCGVAFRVSTRWCRIRSHPSFRSHVSACLASLAWCFIPRVSRLLYKAPRRSHGVSSFVSAYVPQTHRGEFAHVGHYNHVGEWAATIETTRIELEPYTELEPQQKREDHAHKQ